MACIFFTTGSTEGLGNAAAQALLDDGHEVVQARNRSRAVGISALAGRLRDRLRLQPLLAPSGEDRGFTGAYVEWAIDCFSVSACFSNRNASSTAYSASATADLA
jgi:NAD(P)-dependent dehydrogenase (short-subunit alcohol dehydrogenase family)